MKEMKKENGKEEERGKEAFILSTANFIRQLPAGLVSAVCRL
jgi:hypothetical protein